MSARFEVAVAGVAVWQSAGGHPATTRDPAAQ